MRPPYHPEHPESVTSGKKPAPVMLDGQGRPVVGTVPDSSTVVARCGRHFTGPAHALGQADTARLLADDFNAHRATYVQAVSA